MKIPKRCFGATGMSQLCLKDNTILAIELRRLSFTRMSCLRRRAVIGAEKRLGMVVLALFTIPVGATTPDATGAREGLSASQSGTVSAPLSLTRDPLRDGSLGPEMVVIPPGKFQMGCVSGKWCQSDDQPGRVVRFERPFAIGKFEVTFADYDRFAEATGAEKPHDEGFGRGRRPVINVAWNNAAAYASWVSSQTGESYRLPNEAEWEYAARAGTVTAFSAGDCIDTEQANYDGNYGWNDCPKTGAFRRRTVEVGSLPPNPWGLNEVHGNASEWVQDCWSTDYEATSASSEGRNEVSIGACDLRVVRGGSWFDGPVNLRSAARSRNYSGFLDFTLGFRLVKDL